MDQSTDQWHSIRPWIHRFSLSVNQVSSVSATLTLKSALTTKPLDPALESLVEDERDDPTEHPEPRTRSHAVSDALTQGLSVKVNSSPWQRVLLRVHEESDEAIIIIFGLMPGRQYDIELGITHRQELLRSQVTTSNGSSDRSDPNSDSNAHDHNTASGSTAMPIVVSEVDTTTPSIPKSLTTPPGSTPSPTASPTLSVSTSGDVPASVAAPSMTLEDKIQQLNQTLSLLQSERDSLAVSLKTTRRDAQKADAAIRADIETLKRASDKFASVEHRARQKVLALQEAVKQTLAAAADIGTAATDIEASLPSLREQRAEAEKESETATQQAAQAREERDVLERQEKKRIDSLQSELAGLGSKLEKLNGKREKLENSVIPDIEEELSRIEEEIDRAPLPSPPALDRLDDSYYYDPASFGGTNQSGGASGHPGLGGFPEDLHSTGQDGLPGPIESLRRRKPPSHPPLITKHQQPQTQKPVQILRPPRQQHQVRPPLIGHKPTASSSTTTSTLSSLAAPFEPSPKRQAQLQSTLGASLNSSSITSALKAELNTGTNVFAPGMGFTTSSTSVISVSTSGSHKSTDASSNSSNPGNSAWLRGNQKPRRSDAE